jgi:hypothetical protein
MSPRDIAVRLDRYGPAWLREVPPAVLARLTLATVIEGPGDYTDETVRTLASPQEGLRALAEARADLDARRAQAAAYLADALADVPRDRDWQSVATTRALQNEKLADAWRTLTLAVRLEIVTGPDYARIRGIADAAARACVTTPAAGVRVATTTTEGM